MTDQRSTAGPAQEIAVAILRWRDCVLVRRRPDASRHLAGTLEFPGGKIEPGESAQVAACRELREETGLGAEPLTPFRVVEHAYPDRRLRLHFFVSTLDEGLPQPPAIATNSDPDWTWLPLAELAASAVPAANAEVIRELLDGGPR